MHDTNLLYNKWNIIKDFFIIKFINFHNIKLIVPNNVFYSTLILALFLYRLLIKVPSINISKCKLN